MAEWDTRHAWRKPAPPLDYWPLPDKQPQMKRFVVLAILFIPALAFGQQFSSLEERMSSSEFAAAGLDKLSPEELARLNEWLRGNVGRAAVTDAPPAADRIGFREGTVTGVVSSQIDGEFTGWNGKTKFKLKNGQVWQQIDSDARLGGIRLDNAHSLIAAGADLLAVVSDLSDAADPQQRSGAYAALFATGSPLHFPAEQP